MILDLVYRLNGYLVNGDDIPGRLAWLIGLSLLGHGSGFTAVVVSFWQFATSKSCGYGVAFPLVCLASALVYTALSLKEKRNEQARSEPAPASPPSRPRCPLQRRSRDLGHLEPRGVSAAALRVRNINPALYRLA